MDRFQNKTFVRQDLVTFSKVTFDTRYFGMQTSSLCVSKCPGTVAEKPAKSSPIHRRT